MHPKRSPRKSQRLATRELTSISEDQSRRNQDLESTTGSESESLKKYSTANASVDSVPESSRCATEESGRSEGVEQAQEGLVATTSGTSLDISAHDSNRGRMETDGGLHLDTDITPMPPNRAANKLQLRQRFFDLHFGATQHASPIFVYEVLDIVNPKKTALTAAMDTLCVAQLATTFQDEHLVATSRILYGQAIRRLNEKISLVSRQRQPQQSQLDEVVGAINALVPCAWFDCIGAGKSEWLRHSEGLNQIMDTYGRQMLSPGVRDQFYHHWERRVFTNRLFQRKTLPKTILRSRKGRHDNPDFFKECAIPIPGLLDRTDSLLKMNAGKKQNVDAVLDLLTELGQCVAMIKRWQLHWTSEVPMTYRVVNTESFKSFPLLCKQQIGVFPVAYSFRDPGVERNLRLSYMCLLNVLQAIVDIHEAFTAICTKVELKSQLMMAKADSKLAADALCMHVPWDAQPHYKAFACTYTLIPLHHAAKYYKSNGYEAQATWCEEVSRSLSATYGISIDFATDS